MIRAYSVKRMIPRQSLSRMQKAVEEEESVELRPGSVRPVRPAVGLAEVAVEVVAVVEEEVEAVEEEVQEVVGSRHRGDPKKVYYS